VVNVFATGSKGRGFKPGRGDGFLRAIKIRSTSSFGWEVKPEVHVVRFYGMLKIPCDISDTDRQNSHSSVHYFCLPHMSLLVGVPGSSSGRVRSYPQPASSSSSSSWLSMLTYHTGMNNRPVGGRSSET
jgi:hypothetical protein